MSRSRLPPRIIDSEEFPPLPSQSRSEPHVKTKAPRQSNNEVSQLQIHAGLDGLPTELLYQILDYLPPLDLDNFQLSSIINLSRTNRRLHSVVMSTLYATYNSFFCKPYLFLRTLMSNADAAHHVRELKISYGEGVHIEREAYQPTVDDKRIVKAGFKALGLPDWKFWASDCNEEGVEQEMLFAAIMMHAPKITSIQVDDGAIPYKQPKWVELMNHVVNGTSSLQTHHFSELRKVQIDIGRLRLQDLSFLFRMPALHELWMTGLVDFESPSSKKKPFKWPIQPGLSSVARLVMYKSFMDTRNLASLVDSCRALETFRYEHRDERWFYQKSDRHRQGIVTSNAGPPEDLAKMELLDTPISRHCASLKELWLQDTVTRGIYRGQLTSIRRMERLELLHAPLSLLIDIIRGDPATLVDNLPSSLKRICVHISKSRELAFVNSITYPIPHCSDLFPSLESIIVQTHKPMSRTSRDCVKRMFAGLEIELRDVIKPQGSPWYNEFSMSDESTDSESEDSYTESSEELDSLSEKSDD